MEGRVGEFDTGCRARGLNSGFVARGAARIGVDHACSDLVGMKRSPANPCRSDFRKGRSGRERRRSCRKNTIDTEISSPRLARHAKRPADEDCLLAGCVDKKLTLDTLRAVDNEGSDRSVLFALDD